MSTRFFENVLAKHLNLTFSSYQNVGGGCINNAAKLTTNNGAVFIKWNDESEADMFVKEALGLERLAKHSSLQIPKVLGKGIVENKAYLLLEWIESGYASSQFWEEFGIGLTKTHRNTSEFFGLDHNNYIGRLPQSNKKHSNWVDFFVQERLEPQLQLARKNKLIDSSISGQFNILYQKLELFIPQEPASFIHGDLWSGNFMTNANSQPVLVDPAVHFGHRETELAFTTMFGGFDRSFYDHYTSEFPLEPGFEDRIEIHNLYPLLVHVNLFGSSYLSGILRTLKRYS